MAGFIKSRNLTYLGISSSAADVTPSDTVDLTQPGTLFVGDGGNVRVDMVDGGTVTYNNIASGTFLPVLIKRVYSTNTTASDIIVNY